MAEPAHEVVRGEGFSVGHLDAMGDGPGFRKVRRELDETDVTVLELVTPGVDTDMMDQVQSDYQSHSSTTERWDHVDPADWAEKVVKAIENEDDELKPSGVERLAQMAPKAILDVAAKRGFKR